MIEYQVKVESDGFRSWYLNGKRHREDGPAVEDVYGNKAWYLNGKLHREDGPALEWGPGYKAWWLNGKEYTEKEFNAKMNPCANKIVTIDGIKYKLTPA